MPNQFADMLEYFIRKLPGREQRHHLPPPPQRPGHRRGHRRDGPAGRGGPGGGHPVRQRRAHRQRGHGHPGHEHVHPGGGPGAGLLRHQQDPGDVRALHQDAGGRPAALCGRAGVHRLLRQPPGRHQQGHSVYEGVRHRLCGRSPICPSTPPMWAGSTSPSSASTPSPARAAPPSSWSTTSAIDLPKAMHPEFGAHRPGGDRPGGHGAAARAQSASCSSRSIWRSTSPYKLLKHAFTRDRQTAEGHSQVAFTGHPPAQGHRLRGVPARATAPSTPSSTPSTARRWTSFTFVDYKSARHHQRLRLHGRGLHPAAGPRDGKDVFGVGVSHNINLAPLRGILCAINRYQRKKEAAKAE